jgi:hypothetical protein
MRHHLLDELHHMNESLHALVRASTDDPAIGVSEFIELAATILHLNRTIFSMTTQRLTLG